MGLHHIIYAHVILLIFLKGGDKKKQKEKGKKACFFLCKGWVGSAVTTVWQAEYSEDALRVSLSLLPCSEPSADFLGAEALG